MNNPKEKAEELFYKFYLVRNEFGLCKLNEYTSKQCAFIAIDEIINTEALLNEIDAECIEGYSDTIRLEYWQQVKQEIQSL
jgi:hypothetical protein